MYNFEYKDKFRSFGGSFVGYPTRQATVHARLRNQL